MAGRIGNYTFHFRDARPAAEAVENAKKGNLSASRHGNNVTVVGNGYRSLFGQSWACLYGDWVHIANNAALYRVTFDGQQLWPSKKKD